MLQVGSLLVFRAQLTCASDVLEDGAVRTCAGIAVYSIDVETRWTTQTHPSAFSGTDAAFANIHGITHTSRSMWPSPAQRIQCEPEYSTQEGSFKVEVQCPQPGELLLWHESLG